MDRSYKEDEGTRYQTIVSYNKQYSDYIVMGTYDSLKEARSNYMSDVRRYSEENNLRGVELHYGIKMLNNTPNEEHSDEV